MGIELLVFEGDGGGPNRGRDICEWDDGAFFLSVDLIKDMIAGSVKNLGRFGDEAGRDGGRAWQFPGYI